jgi:protein SCO1/2
MNYNVKGLVENFGKDSQVKFLSFTVDPEKDSVAALAAYAKKMGADSTNWWFLTGNKDSIYALAVMVFSSQPPAEKQLLIFFTHRISCSSTRKKEFVGSMTDWTRQT